MRNPMIGVVGLTYGSYSNNVTCIAINSTNDTIATGSNEGWIVLWHSDILPTSNNDNVNDELVDIYPTSISLTSRFPATTPIIDICFIASSFPNTHLNVRDNFASLHADNSVCIWSLIDARCIARINLTFKIDRIEVLPNRRFIVTFSQTIHILDTWTLEIIAKIDVSRPIFDLTCSLCPQLNNLKQEQPLKHLICAITDDILNCWDVTNTCLTKVTRMSKTEFGLQSELSNVQLQPNRHKNKWIKQMKVHLNTVDLSDKVSKNGIKHQICVSNNLIFAIAGPRITVWVVPLNDDELHPLMDFLNPDIETNNSNWRYIQLINLLSLKNLANRDALYTEFINTHKMALLALNDQNKLYCYILPEYTSTSDEYPRFHSQVQATYVGEITGNLNIISYPIFVIRGFRKNRTASSDKHKMCCLDIIAIFANSEGMFVQRFSNSRNIKNSIDEDIADSMDNGMKMIFPMEKILLNKSYKLAINVSNLAILKVNHMLYITYGLINGYISCIGKKGRIKLQLPQILLDYVTSKNKITKKYRIIYTFTDRNPLNNLKPTHSGTIKCVECLLPVNDHLIISDRYTICIYKFSSEIFPVYLISGWHMHNITSIHQIIVPMGSLTRQSLDHFASIDSSGRVIIWCISSLTTSITQCGDLPHSHYMLERAGIRNVYKIVLDEPRCLAIIITLKRILIWSLDTQSLILNEPKSKYAGLPRPKLESNQTSSDPFTSLVPHLKNLVYGNDPRDNNDDGRNYRSNGKNGLKLSIPRYRNVLFCKELFKEEPIGSSGSFFCANLQLKCKNNKLICLPIIASPVASQIASILSFDTFPIKFLPCSLGAFWTTIHLTMPIIPKFSNISCIREIPDIRLHIYAPRSSYVCNIFDLSQIPYKLYKNPPKTASNIDRIWLLGHYILVGSLPGQSHDLMIMGRRSEYILKKLFNGFNSYLCVSAIALLLSLLMNTRFYIQKLKVLSYPEAIYVIDKWTYSWIISEKLSDKILVQDIDNMQPVAITEQDIIKLKDLPRTTYFKPKKTISTGILQIGLTPQFPIEDIACTLLAILIYEKPVKAFNTYVYIDNTIFSSNSTKSNSSKDEFFGENAFVIAMKFLGCKIFCYSESYEKIPAFIPPLNGFKKAEHTALFSRLLKQLFPLLSPNTSNSLIGSIVNNVMLGYPHTTFGVKREFKHIITTCAIYFPEILSDSIYFAQLSNPFVAEIIYHLLSCKLITCDLLHLFSYQIAITLATKQEVRNLLYVFPMISIHEDTVAFGFINGNVHLYSIRSAQLIREFFAHESPITCLTLDSTGENIAVYQHQEPALHVWKVSSYNFFKNFTTSANNHKTVELKKLHGDFTAGLDSVKIQFKSKTEWFLHREDGRAYIVRA